MKLTRKLDGIHATCTAKEEQRLLLGQIIRTRWAGLQVGVCLFLNADSQRRPYLLKSGRPKDEIKRLVVDGCEFGKGKWKSRRKG